MSELTLQSVYKEAEALITTEAYEESMTLCQHSLRYYPKNRHAYTLLGLACIGLGNSREAADMFRRVLSTDPENFTARATLGEIFADEGTLDEAIWQTERAFELNPGDAEVRERLRDLHRKRHGMHLQRLKLNSAALGRLYARGRLYDLAIEEFLELLEKDPARVDIRISLAEALWSADRRQEAAIISEELLAELPNCLKANLILGQIWTESGLDEGWDRLQLAQAIDPENRVAQQMFGVDSLLPLQDVNIPPVGTAPPVVVEETPEDTPDQIPPWLQSLSSEDQKIVPPALETFPPDGALESDKGLWVVDLRAATDAALSARPPAPQESERRAMWITDLRAATDEALQLRQAGSAMPREKTAPWTAELRRETDKFIADYRPPVETPPDEAPAWIGALREKTADAITGWTAPRVASVLPPWVPALRLATDQALAPPQVEEWNRAPKEETLQNLEMRNWVGALHEETASTLAQWQPPAEPLEPTVQEEIVPAETTEEPILEETPEQRPEVEAAPEETPEQQPEVEAAPEEAPEQQPVAEVFPEETPEQQAVKEATSEERPEQQPEKAAPSAERLTALYQQLDADPDDYALRLELAGAHRQLGQRDEAIVQFTRLVGEAPEISPQLIESLRDWAQEEPDDLEVQQLLGDAYAEADRLSEALAQYRHILSMNHSS